MNRYGQTLTWGTLTAPHLFTGHCRSYSYRDAKQRQVHDDESGDNVAITLHSRKAEINFSAEVTSASTDFLDLSGDAAKIVVSGVTGGVILASRAVETWRLGQRKTASVTATHYPDFAVTTGTAAGVANTAFTPDQSALTVNFPGGAIIWGTFGMTHASGVIHGLTLEQQLTLTEDEVNPAGTILGCAAHGYMRTIQLDVLAQAAGPAVGSTLTLTDGPTQSADYLVESCEQTYQDKRGKMYAIGAVWIPPFTA